MSGHGSYVGLIILMLFCCTSAVSQNECDRVTKFVVDTVQFFNLKHLVLILGEQEEPVSQCALRGCISRYMASKMVYLTFLRRMEDIGQLLKTLSIFGNRITILSFQNINHVLRVLTDIESPLYQLPLKDEHQHGLALASSNRWILVVPEEVHLDRSLADGTPAFADSDVCIARVSQRFGHVLLEDLYRVCETCPARFFTLGNWTVLNGWSMQVFDKYLTRKNLEGAVVKTVGVTVTPFYASYEKDRITGGLFGNLMLLLSQELNFTYQATVLQGYQFGKFQNGNWTGMIGKLHRGEVDVTSNELSVSVERVGIVDYTQTILYISRRMYLSTRGLWETKWWYYADPMSPILFMCTILLLLAIATGMWMADRYSRISTSQEQDTRPLNLPDSFFSMVSALCQTGSALLPCSLQGRFVFWLGALSFLIIFTGYSATLTSHLAVALRPALPFYDLAGLVQKGDWKAGPIKGDLANIAMESVCPHYRDSSQECYWMVELWQRIVSRDERNMVGSYKAGIEKLLLDKYVFMAVKDGVRYHLEALPEDDRCAVAELEPDYLIGGLAFATRRNWPLRKLFNTAILKMRELGLENYLRQKWLPKVRPCLNLNGTEIVATFEEVLFLVLLLTVGIIGSVILLFVERMIRQPQFHRRPGHHRPDFFHDKIQARPLTS